MQVFKVFEQQLKAGGLSFCQQHVMPISGYSGLGDNEDVYDGGYAMYFVHHRLHPCECWAMDMGHMTWDSPLYT